jgi:methyltransferase
MVTGTTSLLAYELLLGLVVLERCAELVVSRRHTRAMLARGAIEHGAGHYPPMVALHTLFLLGCALEPWLADRRFIPAVGLPMLAAALAAQGMRWWAIATLGVYWNTRIIVLPSARRVTSGPYRWFPHPNYLAVIAEGIALPLVHSAWVTATVFTVLNAMLLSVRIRVEDSALAAMGSRR